MRPVKIFTIGVIIAGMIIFIAGIVLVMITPVATTWKTKSEILASEEPLALSAGWNSENDSLIDKLITVDSYETYDYSWGYTPWVSEGSKDFVVTGTAIELSSPQRLFNFYVFDSINFDLWEAGANYTAYYETMGSASVDFGFSIATDEELPNSFYFVVEEYDLDPVVYVNATSSWAEKTSIYDCSEYFVSYGTWFIPVTAKDIVLKGNATEVANHEFNFYIFDTNNYFDWTDGQPYISYYEVTNVTTTSFSVSLTPDEAESTMYFVAENILLDTSEIVEVSATIEWRGEAITETIVGMILRGIVALIGFIVMIGGITAFAVLEQRPPVAPTRICPQCGMTLPPDVKFCPYCGKTLT